MKKQLAILFILSIFVMLILQSQHIATLYVSHELKLAELLPVILLDGFYLFAASILIPVITRIIYRLFKKKRSPDFIILCWSIWIPFVIVLVVAQVHLSLLTLSSENTTSILTAKDIYSTLSNSIYAVYTKDKKDKVVASGSAVSVAPDKLATNCHVLDEGDHFTVGTENKEYKAELYSEHGDLCIINVTDMKFTPVDIRPSKDVQIGESVYAIGNPEGFDKTISNGIISNKHDMHGIIILQTTAPISHGSSGGGLFDLNGKLIGITSGAYVGDDAQNINLVIPTELIQAALLEPTVDKPPVNSDAAAANKSSDNKQDEEIKLLGPFGQDKIAIVKSTNDCFIAIPGRNKAPKISSYVVYFPDLSNGILIFTKTASIGQLLEFFNWISDQKDVDYVDSKSVIFFNGGIHALSQASIHDKKQPLYVYSIKGSILQPLATQDSFFTKIDGYEAPEKTSTINFGLDGFTEAMSEYDKKCQKPKD